MLAKPPRKQVDIIIDQGATFQLSVIWKDENDDPIDITGYSAVAEIRPNRDSATVIQTITTNIATGTDGQVDLSIPHADTENLDFGNETYRWDLIIESPSGVKTRIVEGRAQLSKDITE